jgi:hypothetical protein
MPRSSSPADAVRVMLRDLVEADDLARRLDETAPGTVALEGGGAQALVAARGHPTGAWFWSISPVPESLWERMADEHQQVSRASSEDT